MLRKLALGDALRPIDRNDEEAILPNDGARLVEVEFGLGGCPWQRRLPKDILVRRPTPGQREVLLIGETLAAGATPSGPDVAGTNYGGSQQREAD
jgi:hypothetical protein